MSKRSFQQISKLSTPKSDPPTQQPNKSSKLSTSQKFTYITITKLINQSNNCVGVGLEEHHLDENSEEQSTSSVLGVALSNVGGAFKFLKHFVRTPGTFITKYFSNFLIMPDHKQVNKIIKKWCKCHHK